MKRILLMVMAVSAIGLTACSKDKDNDGDAGSSTLVGRWEALVEYELENGKWAEFYTYEPGECIIEFNETKYTVHDKNDLGNAQAVSYTYDPGTKKVKVGGLFELIVHKLTAEELQMGSKDLIGDAETKTTYKRIK